MKKSTFVSLGFDLIEGKTGDGLLTDADNTDSVTGARYGDTQFPPGP
ncbi:hypothetical protein [Paraburkholderia sp. HP33-1]|nr:hypothetical protein [Paraburkholderia sp. HP33-1]